MPINTEDALARLAAEAGLGRAVLAAVRESGLAKPKRRARRVLNGHAPTRRRAAANSGNGVARPRRARLQPAPESRDEADSRRHPDDID